MTDLTQDFSEQIRDAASGGKSLLIQGGGSKSWYGNEAKNVDEVDILGTSGHTGMVDYDPAELVITARTGTSLIELEQVLANHGQMLAFEPPRHTDQATLGGAIATALSGPSRPFVGGVRDFVLGMYVIDGRGDLLRFGGQVMKNVAGYDVSRLMTGAMGVLGLISQVSLKVLPVPPASATLRFEFDQSTAIERVNTWSGRPLPITATAWHQGVLHIRLSGAQAAVGAAMTQLGGTHLSSLAAQNFWAELRHQTAAFFKQDHMDKLLWRLSLPSTAPVLTPAHLPGADDILVEWGGAQRWFWSDATPSAVRSLARSLGGHAVCFDARRGGCDAFESVSPALMAIHQRLKQQFDPQGVFNPGRLYPGL